MKLLRLRCHADGGPSTVVVPYVNIDSMEQHLDNDVEDRCAIYTVGGATYYFEPGAVGNPQFDEIAAKLATHGGRE